MPESNTPLGGSSAEWVVAASWSLLVRGAGNALYGLDLNGEGTNTQGTRWGLPSTVQRWQWSLETGLRHRPPLPQRELDQKLSHVLLMLLLAPNFSKEVVN
jgi:hypothetical protein